MNLGSLFTGSNPVRARASGLAGGSGDTDSVSGELLGAIVVEMLILIVMRKYFGAKRHGG